MDPRWSQYLYYFLYHFSQLVVRHVWLAILPLCVLVRSYVTVPPCIRDVLDAVIPLSTYFAAWDVIGTYFSSLLRLWRGFDSLAQSFSEPEPDSGPLSRLWNGVSPRVRSLLEPQATATPTPATPTPATASEIRHIVDSHRKWVELGMERVEFHGHFTNSTYWTLGDLCVVLIPLLLILAAGFLLLDQAHQQTRRR
ncbi:hypothetical protein F4780DRAFT_585140 [Xylariomycetidae sp. FL0641]|nr:hypothetical protein F4780DRAFT_585140 [Xylariomycetidae sp. FL0641]